MSKNVLILSSSPRAKGNSDTLCDEFAKGAVSGGHTAEKVFLKSMDIHYCTGCGYCANRQGSCTQADDMRLLRTKMLAADVIVLATPIYFYTMCGQLKTFIDRNCFFYTELSGKEFYYIMTAADGDTAAMDRTVEELRGYLSCLDGAKEKGILCATGVWNVGDIADKKYLKEAYNMGAKI